MKDEALEVDLSAVSTDPSSWGMAIAIARSRSENLRFTLHGEPAYIAGRPLEEWLQKDRITARPTKQPKRVCPGG